MDKPSYAPRDACQDSDDAIRLLRAYLTVITDAYENLLENGPPPRGRSVDDKDAHYGWQLQQARNIERAREALRLTADGWDGDARSMR